MTGFLVGWNLATGFGMPLEYMVSSSARQPSSSASQPMNQQVNVSASQPTQSQDAAQAPQPSVTPALAQSLASPSNMSAPWPTSQQQNLAMMIQPKSPTEVLTNRLPHAHGVTWVFHDPVTGFVRHVNVPNIPPVAQQQSNQMSAQSSHSNEMVLYQSPSNQITQHVARTASADQPMGTPSAQPALVALPIAPPALQPASTDGQQIDWASKIAKVMRVRLS
jgi:hypothetical protein